MTATTHATTHPVYTVRAIDPVDLARLRDTDDAGRATKPYTDEEGGAPLRCCLRRSAVGEEIALVSYAPLTRWANEHGADPGPYLELGPVFIHADTCTGPASDSYPADLHGLRVLRAYDARGHILGGRLVDTRELGGAELDMMIEQELTAPEVELLHVRAVEFGCYFFELRRANTGTVSPAVQ